MSSTTIQQTALIAGRTTGVTRQESSILSTFPFPEVTRCLYMKIYSTWRLHGRGARHIELWPKRAPQPLILSFKLKHSQRLREDVARSSYWPLRTFWCHKWLLVRLVLTQPEGYARAAPCLRQESDGLSCPGLRTARLR